jgi:hypothetical protein
MRVELSVSDDFRIYVDAGQPATLNDGVGALTDYDRNGDGAAVSHVAEEACWLGIDYRQNKRSERRSKSLADRSIPLTRSIGFITDQSRGDQKRGCDRDIITLTFLDGPRAAEHAN